MHFWHQYSSANYLSTNPSEPMLAWFVVFIALVRWSAFCIIITVVDKL